MLKLSIVVSMNLNDALHLMTFILQIIKHQYTVCLVLFCLFPNTQQGLSMLIESYYIFVYIDVLKPKMY